MKYSMRMIQLNNLPGEFLIAFKDGHPRQSTTLSAALDFPPRHFSTIIWITMNWDELSVR